jgi:flagellar hook-associated protein 3 FlgL
VTVPASDVLRAGGGMDVAQAIGAMLAALGAGEAPPADAGEALSAIGDRAAATQASLGARAARVELVAGQLTDAAVDREAATNDLEAVDMTQAITDLQKTMTVLQATQASFSKLSSLSLFDYLR